jgi:hypothetical protein
MTMGQILNDLWSFVKPKRVFDPPFDPQQIKPEPKNHQLTSGQQQQPPSRYHSRPACNPVTARPNQKEQKQCRAKQNPVILNPHDFWPRLATFEAAPDTLQAVSDSTISQGFTGAQLNQHL